MSTVREVVSRVRSMDKLISSDNSITDRAIMRELKSKAIFYIKRDTDRRRLWSSSTIFTNIPCLEMEPVSIAECCDYRSDVMVSRSKQIVPSISEGIFGLLIHGVFSPDLSRKIKEVNIPRYINLLKLGLHTTDVYYWFYDRRIYVSSPEVKLLNLWAYFEEDVPDEVMYPDCECSGKGKKNPCQNPLDLEFKCPGYLIDVVVKDTLDTLLKTYFRLQVDHSSDDKDDQVNKV